jgi:hypothetical protein
MWKNMAWFKLYVLKTHLETNASFHCNYCFPLKRDRSKQICYVH